MQNDKQPRVEERSPYSIFEVLRIANATPTAQRKELHRIWNLDDYNPCPERFKKGRTSK